MMKNAIETIAVQHELAMALGNSLDLREALLQFMNALVVRLELDGAHLYLQCDESGEPVLEATLDSRLSHFLSVPFPANAYPAESDDFLMEYAIKHQSMGQSYSVQYKVGSYYHVFSVPGYGVIILSGQIDFAESFLQTLPPIFKKLSTNCYACIVHSALLKEIDARKEAESRVVYQANHDELTRLCNRRQLTSALDKALHYCRVEGKYGAIIFIDLNQFKAINDAMGHEVGDKILQEVAGRLTGVMRDRDTIARFGGDEFIVLLPDLGASEDLAEEIVWLTSKRIQDVVSAPFVLAESTFHIGCSMGYEIFSATLNSASDVIKHADLAMYEAKSLRQSAALRYIPSMSERLNLQSVYLADLKRALRNNEFALYYQPQFNIFGEVIGAEALLRWQNPERLNDSPDSYIPIAEDSDLIHAIGDWVIHESCRHLKMLQQHELPRKFQKLSINVSAKQLGHVDFYNKLYRAIQVSGVDSRQLSIEITENVLIGRIHDTLNLMKKLLVLGVDCAIDDFGTGYSSLSYLRRLPSTLIKIDRAFVKDIHKDVDNQSIAKMIIVLAESLGMNVLAEGVETKEELECLKRLGCDRYQGFYFSRPVPFDQFMNSLIAPPMYALQ